MTLPQQLGFGFDQIEKEKATAHLPSEIEQGIAHYRGMLEQYNAAMLAGDEKEGRRGYPEGGRPPRGEAQ